MKASKASEIFNIPNSLSFARILLAGIFWLFINGLHNYIGAAVILAVAGITDFLDGYVARHSHKVTELGKVIDPVADRILLICVGLVVLISHLIVLWLLIIILAREFIMSVSTIVLALLKAKRIDVLWLGKAGTFGIMGSIPIFIISYAAHRTGIQVVGYWVAWICVIPALVLSWLATIKYVPLAINAYKQRGCNS
jgi:cardiolipin synthase